MQIDLSFPVRGVTVPGDHSYLLFSSLSHRLRDFHTAEGGFRFAPISGERSEPGHLRINGFSRLRIRLCSEKIQPVLALTGQTLQIGQHNISLGPPTVFPLVPAPTLLARLVTFKHSTDTGHFLETAQQKLLECDVCGEPAIPTIINGPRSGEPCRKIIRIKGKAIIGYSLIVEGLTADESIRLQEQGLGGRTRIGCGFFLPYRPRAS
jgi:CRISPR-associated protein Cas6